MKTNNEQLWLCKCDINWADEADFTWYEIFDSAEKRKIEKLLQDHENDEITVYFGTNEESEFTGSDFDSCLSWIKIPSDEVKNFLEKHIIGYGSEISNTLERFEELDDNDVDDSDEFDDED